MTTITRVGFCPHCFRDHKPITGQVFLAFGVSSNLYKVNKANRIGQEGFTPHTYKLIKVIGSNVIIEKACGMYTCGVDREWTNDSYWFYFFTKESWERVIYPVERWNALVLLKNIGYEI